MLIPTDQDYQDDAILPNGPPQLPADNVQLAGQRPGVQRPLLLLSQPKRLIPPRLLYQVGRYCKDTRVVLYVCVFLKRKYTINLTEYTHWFIGMPRAC